MNTLKNLFLNELGDIYDAERRASKAFPRMAKVATLHELQVAIRSHQEMAEAHMAAIERVFGAFDKKARVRPCGATIGILEEGDELMEDYGDSPAVNAALLCVLRKLKHHGMAQYGCLCEWAAALGSREAAGILNDILKEEEAADAALAKLGRAVRIKAALALEVTDGTAKQVSGRSSGVAHTSGLERRANAPTLE